MTPPGNILIAADGPRVIDFGISRPRKAPWSPPPTTIGTPAYMSPEQAQGHPVGPASDIFSLGSVLTFAATGAAPFGGSGTEMFAIAYRLVNGEPDLSRVPGSLRPLVGACLAKDPAARPADGRLIADVASGATAYPQVTPGRFWPDEVAAVLESAAFTPVLLFADNLAHAATAVLTGDGRRRRRAVRADRGRRPAGSTRR